MHVACGHGEWAAYSQEEVPGVLRGGGVAGVHGAEAFWPAGAQHVGAHMTRGREVRKWTSPTLRASAIASW